MRKAFTLIELIIVIVIIGVLGTIGSDIFMHLYTSYYESKIKNELQNHTELALDQISNRLTYRVKSSPIIHTGGVNFLPLESAAGQAGTLEWIGYDNDSLRGMAPDNTLASTYLVPGWSGLIDLDQSTAAALTTLGCRLDFASAIIADLSYADINLSSNTAGNNTAVLIYPDAQGVTSEFGWYGNAATRVHPVYALTNTQFARTAGDFSGSANEVYEHYMLAFSAYALALNGTTLTLHYNYQPWNGETYLTHGNSSVLLENVSTLQFLQIGELIKIQLCVQTPAFFGDQNYSFCKEKAIF